jgi:hypothetical protein
MRSRLYHFHTNLLKQRFLWQNTINIILKKISPQKKANKQTKKTTTTKTNKQTNTCTKERKITQNKQQAKNKYCK